MVRIKGRTRQTPVHVLSSNGKDEEFDLLNLFNSKYNTSLIKLLNAMICPGVVILNNREIEKSMLNDNKNKLWIMKDRSIKLNIWFFKKIILFITRNLKKHIKNIFWLSFCRSLKCINQSKSERSHYGNNYTNRNNSPRRSTF